MPIKQNISDKQMEEEIQRRIDMQVSDMIKQMLYIGNEALSYVRLKHEYTDREGVLTSSTGYKVLYDGKDMGDGGFDPILNGQEGSETGKALIESLISNYQKGLVLLFVAGAKYAVCVEAKGYDVITGGQLKAEQLILQIMDQLGVKLTEQ